MDSKTKRLIVSGWNRLSGSSDCPIESAQTAIWVTAFRSVAARLPVAGDAISTDRETTPSIRPQTSAGMALGRNWSIRPLTESSS
jgi:hypothetical protein